MLAVSGIGICCSSQLHFPCGISPGRGQEWPASRSRKDILFTWTMDPPTWYFNQEHFFLCHSSSWQVGWKQHNFWFPTGQFRPGQCFKSPESKLDKPCRWSSLVKLLKVAQASQLWLGQRVASKEKQEAAQLKPRPQLTEIGVPSSLQQVTLTSVALKVMTSL